MRHVIVSSGYSNMWLWRCLGRLISQTLTASHTHHGVRAELVMKTLTTPTK